VVAYGHTHAPSLVNANRVLWVNPGHLRTGDNRGFKPSFAVLDLQPDGIEAVIHDLKTGWVLSRMVFPRMGGDK
jgi:predicted phosphodiesterase